MHFSKTLTMFEAKDLLLGVRKVQPPPPPPHQEKNDILVKIYLTQLLATLHTSSKVKYIIRNAQKFRRSQ